MCVFSIGAWSGLKIGAALGGRETVTSGEVKEQMAEEREWENDIKFFSEKHLYCQ